MPSLIVASAIALALGIIEMDAVGLSRRLPEHWPRLFGAEAAGSRSLLAAIGSSMITVAGVTFSITVVTLALASTQYSPRILRNFMRDSANQTVLGVFVGVFVYCIVVLRTIRGGEDSAFVPRLAVFTAVILALVAVGFLIYFIHHVATSIQATAVIKSAAVETIETIDRLFPSADVTAQEQDDEPLPAPSLRQSSAMIPALKSGYVQAVEVDRLSDFARKHSTVIQMEKWVGEFVTECGPLLSASHLQVNDAIIKELNTAYSIANDRAMHHDVGYGIQQIVDIALKALSPGINDTTTAIHCVDFLGVILVRLAPRRIATPDRYDGPKLCLKTCGPTFAGLLGEAFGPIRQNASGNVAVLTRCLCVLAAIYRQTSDPLRRRALRQEAGLLMEVADRTVPSGYDRASIHSAHAQIADLAIERHE